MDRSLNVWRPPTDIEPLRATRSAVDDDDPYNATDCRRFPLIPFADIGYSGGDRWLIKGLLASTGLATIFGPPKQYKSFVALDVALHIAWGRTWAGRAVRQGAVIYVCAEGAVGFGDRVAANRERSNIPPDLPFYLIKARPNLGAERGDTQGLIDAISPVVQSRGPVAAIFIDTLARTLAGANENDDGMRNFTDNAETLSDHFRCATIAVHHTGKDATRGMRGSSALHGAVTTSWRVEKTDPMRARITLEDAKDGESGLTWSADLERFVYGRDDDGDELSVLVVSRVSEPECEGQTSVVPTTVQAIDRPPPAQLRLFLSCLDTAMASSSRLDRPFPDGPKIRVAPLMDVRAEYFLRRGDDASDDAKRKSFDNQVKVAIERKIIGVQAIGVDKVSWRLS